MHSFPPHCSYCLQPLNRSIYRPFKKCFNKAADEWHLNKPGKRMKIYNLTALVAMAYANVVMPLNIQASIKLTGIYSFNNLFFTERRLDESVFEVDCVVND